MQAIIKHITSTDHHTNYNRVNIHYVKAHVQSMMICCDHLINCKNLRYAGWSFYTQAEHYRSTSFFPLEISSNGRTSSVFFIDSQSLLSHHSPYLSDLTASTDSLPFPQTPPPHPHMPSPRVVSPLRSTRSISPSPSLAHDPPRLPAPHVEAFPSPPQTRSSRSSVGIQSWPSRVYTIRCLRRCKRHQTVLLPTVRPTFAQTSHGQHSIGPRA